MYLGFEGYFSRISYRKLTEENVRFLKVVEFDDLTKASCQKLWRATYIGICSWCHFPIHDFGFRFGLEKSFEKFP